MAETENKFNTNPSGPNSDGDLQTILFGDSTVRAVEKVNTAIEQVNWNEDEIQYVEETVIPEIDQRITTLDKQNIKSIVVGDKVTQTIVPNSESSNKAILPVYTTLEIDGKLAPFSNTADCISLADDAEKEDHERIGYTIEGPTMGIGGRNIDLPVYSKDKIDQIVADLSAGMSYIGTITDFLEEEPYPDIDEETGLPLLPESEEIGEGWGCITRDPNRHVFQRGDTMKVDHRRDYAWPVGEGEKFFGQVIELGDLVICRDATYKEDENGALIQLVYLELDIIPSGDDGDVYSSVTWKTGGQIIVTGETVARGKEVTTSYKTIVNEIKDTTTGNNLAHVPTGQAVKSFVENDIKMVSMNPNVAPYWLSFTGEDESLNDKGFYLTGHYNYLITGVYNNDGRPVIANITHNFNKGSETIPSYHTIKIDVDHAMFTNTGFVLLKRMAAE